MNLDPFRIQILTLALDSRTVLVLVGLVVAGYVFGASTRRQAVDAEMTIWWDVLVSAIVGGRVAWVVLNAEYFVRSPQQVLVITDGGLDPLGLLLGAGYALWKVRRRGDRLFWVAVASAVGISALTVLLFERAGCALTTCGSGPMSTIAWAMQRGDEPRQPLALYQAGILGLALVLVGELPTMRPMVVLGLCVGAAMLSTSVGVVVGGQSELEMLLVLGLAGILGVVSVRGCPRPRASRAIGP